MTGGRVGRRYARALYELAEQKKLVRKVGEDLSGLAGAWERSDELKAVFLNPKFSAEEKRRVIEALARRLRCQDLVIHALRMLADRGRLEHLPAISDAYERIAERRSGRIRAEVVTATKLPETYYAQLQKQLERATGKKVTLVRSEDPSLIAGVITTVGGRVFDGSLQNRLRELRNQLLASTDPALSER